MSAYGWPNDEACRRHPVFGGSGGYGLYEVIDSPWDEWVTEQNRYSFPNSQGGRSKHFFVLGHDTSFNCLANEVTTRLFSGWGAAMAEVSRVILAD